LFTIFVYTCVCGGSKHYGLRRNSVNTQGTAVVNNVNGKKEKEYCNNNVNSRRKNRCRNSIIRKAIKQQGKFI
jgi:hypothetical protein